MASTVNATLQISPAVSISDNSNPNFLLSPSIVFPSTGNGFKYTWGTGTAKDTIDKVFIVKDTINTSTPKTYDLSGALTDPVKNTVIFAKVCAILVYNASTTVGEIIDVGNAASAAFFSYLGAATDFIKVYPGGFLCLANPSLAGYPVTATTADILALSAEAGTAVPFEMMILGRSA